MNKVLVIRYGTIGDNIFASAFYRELRKAQPKALISILADDITKGIMEDCPYINNIIEIKGKYKNILNYISIFRNYDTVFFLKNDRFFTMVAFLAGIKNRIGFDIPRNIGLTMTSPYNEDRHEIDCYLELLKLSGITAKDNNTEVWIAKKTDITKNIQVKKVVIHAYSRFTAKNWIDKYWCEVIRNISESFEFQVFFTGSAKDTPRYQNLITQLGSKLKYPPIDTSGRLSVTETMALVRDSDFVISVDSGIIHISAALEIPSILLHGSTSLKRWRPRGKNCTVLTKNFPCSPCCLQTGSKKLCKKKMPECMKALTPDIVINQLYLQFRKEAVHKNIK